ncbi:hypothetical protein [Xanthomonas sp. SS]|uniref:hypothetical protein n=1 Tax=Xanthomonas sp. SS TaxID=2724122 RepID=UPI001639A9D9|nr:hypothetical protein [Xanthomonas sp. SS]
MPSRSVPTSLDPVSPSGFGEPTSSGRGINIALTLKFERTLLMGGKISYNQAAKMLQGKHFDSYMQDVLWQSERDLEASHMTEIYDQALKNALSDGESISIDKFGCGLSICVGSIRTYGDVGKEQYLRFQQALSPAGGTPAYSMIEVPLGEDGEMVEHRFVFAADPRMNGIGDGPRP